MAPSLALEAAGRERVWGGMIHLSLVILHFSFSISTAKRFRPRAEGWFNPGKLRDSDFQPQRGCVRNVPLGGSSVLSAMKNLLAGLGVDRTESG